MGVEFDAQLANLAGGAPDFRLSSDGYCPTYRDCRILVPHRLTIQK